MTQQKYGTILPVRHLIDAPLVSIHAGSNHINELTLLAPEIATTSRPGQFLEILFGDNYSPLVRRPFSIYEVDRDKGTIDILFRSSGSFTSGLVQKRVGDIVNILGPLGSPFLASKSNAILVAGGIGAPPLHFLAKELLQTEDCKTVTIINASRMGSLLIGIDRFSTMAIQLHIVTEDGSAGKKGRADHRMRELLPSATPDTTVYACGPMRMLKAVAEVTEEFGLECQVSVETSMPCGIGTCQGCAIPVHDMTQPNGFRYALACYDGPVFDSRSLTWR